MKQYRYLAQILVLTILAFFLATCDNTPIFYTLEKAYQTSDDRGLEDNIGVQKIVYTKGASTERYFVLAQSIFQRDGGDTANWQDVTPPASGALCGALEYFPGAAQDADLITRPVIAWFYNTSDGSSLGLYKRDPAASRSDPSSWRKINDGDVSDSSVQVNFIKNVDGNLLVSTSVESADTHNLYYSADASDGSFTGHACFGTDLDERIQDIAFDTTDSDYWVITEPGDSGADQPRYLYQDTDGDLSTQNFSDVSAGGPPFWENGSNDPVGTLYTPSNLYYSSTATKLYLSGRQGRIFFRPSGGAWSTWVDPRMTVEISNEDTTVMFTGFAETGKNTEIFVGSIRCGYFYFSSTLAALDASEVNEATASGLYDYFPNDLINGAILSFLAPTDAENADTMFLCTSGAGLWRGDWDGIKWVWRQE
jgi:hypothetical protein